MAALLEWIERRFAAPLCVGADRARATWWCWRGAQLGPKNRIGPQCSLLRPWGLRTGERVQIERGVFIKLVDAAARADIGAFTFIGNGAELDVAGGMEIGSHVLIAPGAFITDHTHHRRAGAYIDTQGIEMRPVRIGDDAWIGAHAVILAGVTVGAGAIVGSGAVVTRDVPAGAIVAGVPARTIGQRAR